MDPDGHPEKGHENRQLRESNPEQGRLLELEVELEQSKDEVAHLTERLVDVSCLEQQLSEALPQGSNSDRSYKPEVLRQTSRRVRHN